MLASSSHAFSKAETNKFMTLYIVNTQQQYGYSIQLIRAYCHCNITKITAYMKQGVKPPPGTDTKNIAQAFINISEHCTHEILTQ